MGSPFPPNIIKTAQEAEKQTRLPAAVSLAQWAQESGFGKSMPPGSNNPFGVKAVSGQPYVECETEEEYKGKKYKVLAKFRKYSSIDQAFLQHAQMIMNPHGLYTTAIPYVSDIYKFIQRMAPIYATDSKYASELISLIEQYHLADLSVKQQVCSSQALPLHPEERQPLAATVAHELPASAILSEETVVSDEQEPSEPSSQPLPDACA